MTGNDDTAPTRRIVLSTLGLGALAAAASQPATAHHRDGHGGGGDDTDTDAVTSPDIDRIFVRDTDPADEYDVTDRDLWIDTSDPDC